MQERHINPHFRRQKAASWQELDPEQWIEQIATVRRGLLVHGNYLTAAEIACVAKHRANLSVVYCPRTHAFFEHAPHPVNELLAAGIRVARASARRCTGPPDESIRRRQADAATPS